jgi:hypothetical protein
MQTSKEGGALSLLSWLPVLRDLPGRPITEGACSDSSKLSDEWRRRVHSRILEKAISSSFRASSYRPHGRRELDGGHNDQLPAPMMTPSPGTAELKIGIVPRDLRFASGLVLFAYITTHLSNHGLGLISLAAAETGLWLLTAMWHSLPGTLLLYSAAGLHFILALRSIYERRTFRLPPLELLRIALGFWMPVLLLGHAITTRLEFELIGAASRS